MRTTLFSILVMISLLSCQTDEQKQKEFAGTYRVTLDMANHKEEMDEAKEDMKKEIEQAKEDMKKEIEQAKEEISNELGEDSNLGDALGKFVEGMGKFAEGMASLGESLGELGLNLGTSLLKDIRFNATFQEDGEVVLGKSKGISLHTGDELRWKIEGGQFVLWSKGEEQNEPKYFSMKKESESEWTLTSEDLILHLEKQH